MKLVIAEKPSVAQSIAGVIGADEKKDGYLEGNGYLVSWCVGHLVEPAAPEGYSERFRKWRHETLPIIPEEWKYEVKPEVRAQFVVLKKLLNRTDVDKTINACDAGREGELIFRLVCEAAGCRKPMERLWISSMEESAVREGFAHLKPGSDYDCLYRAALCRQQADWLVGINGTRLFTVLFGGRTLKVGRVQTPTLAMIVEREETIACFRKETYYTAQIRCGALEAATKRIDDKSMAERMAGACLNGQALVRLVTKEEKSIKPPKLYDLTTLQREANRLFGYSAKQTLEYLQSLYEKKLATYPRTDSRYLSDDMGQTAGEVIEAVQKCFLSEGDILPEPDVGRVLDSKKVSDHHAIIPTVQIAHTDLKALPEGEYKVLSLLANRLLCATGRTHLYQSAKAELACGEEVFYVSGREVTQNGWKTFEEMVKGGSRKPSGETDEEEKKLPVLEEGQRLAVTGTEVLEHFTKPPARYTEDTLLAAMERAGDEEMVDDVERKGIGTPATRAEVIEKLVKDGFVRREKKLLIPTEEGKKLIMVLPDMLKSAKLTADWENALTRVAKGELDSTDFMADIRMLVSALVDECQEADEEQRQIFAADRQVLGKCPHCGGQIVKGKYGAYCENRCGMSCKQVKVVRGDFAFVMGVSLTDVQIKDLLTGKKILLKGLKGKAGKPYDAYITPDGTERYIYTKDGQEKSGVQFTVIMEYPGKKPSGRKGNR